MSVPPEKRTRPAGNPVPTSAGDGVPGARGGAGLFRHLAVGVLAFAFAFMFWRSRMEWDAEMRMWRAMGDAAFLLLGIALLTGPLAVLFPRMGRFVVWRRAFGVWFALTAALHAYLVWNGWARWEFSRLMGFEDLSAAGGPEELVLTDSGFGLANLVGLVALFFALVIAATSSERAMRLLGARAWKHVQQYAYVVFYLVGLHGAYFLFLHYELSLRTIVFRKNIPDPNWFRFWFVGIVLLVILAQLAAFVRIVAKRRGPGRATD